MRTIDITKVVEYREDNRLEAKRASNGLPSSLWETYSSFANTDGGAILLGVDEDKRGNLTVTGVNDADKLLKDFWNIINNRQKVSINILTEKDVTVENIDGKDVIIIHVPRANDPSDLYISVQTLARELSEETMKATITARLTICRPCLEMHIKSHKTRKYYQI